MSRSEGALFVFALVVMVCLSWIALKNIQAKVELASIERSMCRDR